MGGSGGSGASPREKGTGVLTWEHFKKGQEVLGITNRLLSFDTTRTA
jgi:hypothetical protein